MLRKLLRDLNTNRKIEINMENQSETLGYYYIKFDEDIAKLNRLIHSFDKNGVPLNTTYIDVEDTKLHYYPISIGQYGLAIFHSWLKTHSEEKRAHFLRIADWFMNNRTDHSELGCYWLTDVPKPEYHVYQPWKSAFAQSRGISMLLRAWQLTEDDTYLKIATQALIPFTKDITTGGVSVDREKGATFYEEYVAECPTRVLDGHGFCLFGLYDYIRAVPEKKEPNGYALALRLFNEGVEGLTRQLPLFDMGFWPRFNRCDLPGYPQDDPCTIGYLRLIRQQLLILYRITGKEELRLFSEKFHHYDRISNILKMYRHKFTALKKLNRL